VAVKMTSAENSPTPNLSEKLLTALARPARFFIAVPSAASPEEWLIVESANPWRPVAPACSSEVEAWRVAEEMNQREIKQRASELRGLQRESDERRAAED
jgi:hypothetical protein